MANDLARATRLPRERICVAPNPVVPTDVFALAAQPVDHPWFTTGSDPVLLGVGRLAPEKDFATLIRAFARVQRHRPARLMILGEGSERGSLEALVAALGLEDSVSLPGFAINPFAYMTRAGVFVLSSLSEGSPGALIQALACGAPVVATDCQNGPREILDGGRYGRLVPVGDVPALAEAVLAALTDPRSPVPEEAWIHHSQDAAVEYYLGILQVVGHE